MWLRLRQIALVAAELQPVVDDLTAVLGLEVCYVDPGVARFGLENALLPVGNQLLEVVAPVEPGTAGGRYLERRGGDGGYMVITQCDDHAPRRRRVEELGIRIVHQFERGPFQNMQLHPKDTGGSFFEIDCQLDGMAADGPWAPAGPDWQRARRTDVVDAIVAAEIQSPDPEPVARRWSEIAEIPLAQGKDGGWELPLDNATVRFVAATDGRPEGLGGVDVHAVDPGRALDTAARRGLEVAAETVVIGGTRFRLVA
ncbi:MAG: VOC family protein [Thermoanaerobaculia bacterium]|nr:VOC family protein [Thermoanaerobaculia bacterium]